MLAVLGGPGALISPRRYFLCFTATDATLDYGDTFLARVNINPCS
jgi:hypothetical protein